MTGHRGVHATVGQWDIQHAGSESVDSVLEKLAASGKEAPLTTSL